jgi:hypothetical protein
MVSSVSGCGFVCIYVFCVICMCNLCAFVTALVVFWRCAGDFIRVLDMC